MINHLVQLIQTVALVFGGGFALYQYRKQQKFNRLQNLFKLFAIFRDNDAILSLFDLLNSNSLMEVENTSAKTKLAYLALIEEVALFTGIDEVDKHQAKYMFQWHFHYVYNDSATSLAFWKNLGGKEEMNADYWSQSRHIANEFNPMKK